MCVAIGMVMSQSDLERVVVQWSNQEPNRAEAFPLLARSLGKFNPNMQALKRVFDLNSV